MALASIQVVFKVEDISGEVPGEDWFDFTAAGNSRLEILQCVHCLLNTPVGSVTLDRAIGIDYSFVDKPLPLACAMVLAEIPGKIKRYEPRCQLTDVRFEGTTAELLLGKVTCRVRIATSASA
jgi:phage baseplate assembly protein W